MKVRHGFRPSRCKTVVVSEPGDMWDISILISMVLFAVCVAVGATIGGKESTYMVITAVLMYGVYLTACLVGQRAMRDLIRNVEQGHVAEEIASLQRLAGTIYLHTAYRERNGGAGGWCSQQAWGVDDVEYNHHVRSEEVSPTLAVNLCGKHMVILRTEVGIELQDDDTVEDVSRVKQERQQAVATSAGADMEYVHQLYLKIEDDVVHGRSQMIISPNDMGVLPWYLELRTYWIFSAFFLNPLFVVLFLSHVGKIDVTLRRNISVCKQRQASSKTKARKAVAAKKMTKVESDPSESATPSSLTKQNMLSGHPEHSSIEV